MSAKSLTSMHPTGRPVRGSTAKPWWCLMKPQQNQPMMRERARRGSSPRGGLGGTREPIFGKYNHSVRSRLRMCARPCDGIARSPGTYTTLDRTAARDRSDPAHSHAWSQAHNPTENQRGAQRANPGAQSTNRSAQLRHDEANTRQSPHFERRRRGGDYYCERAESGSGAPPARQQSAHE